MSAPTEGAATSDTQVEAVWSAVTAAGLATGNSPTLGYRLEWDNGNPALPGSAFLAFADQTALSKVLTGVVTGDTYRFAISAVNVYGAGPASTIASIVASDIPSQPVAPTTVRSGTDIIVSWLIPANNGAAISDQEVRVLDKNTGTYVEDTAQCDALAATTTCTWPIAYLTTNQGYQVGETVQFDVRAQNADGWGSYSNANSVGAIIQTIPGSMPAPTEGATTGYTQMQVTWSALTTTLETGATPILSYALEWDAGTGATGSPTWTVLKGDPTVDTLLTYTVVNSVATPITPGAAYLFRVRASNDLGWGGSLATLSITPSSAPDAPGEPSSSTSTVYI